MSIADNREHGELYKELAELKLENAELRKDKRRLDWLADLDNNIGQVLLPTECVQNNIHSMRDAIDEAMRGSK